MVRRILLGVVLLLVSSLMVGCGVAQEEYDRVTSDLSAAQAQIKTLESDYDKAKNDLSTVQSQIKNLEGDYAKAESNLSAAQSQIKTLQGDYDDQKAKIAKATAYARALHIYLYPIRKEAGIPQKLSYPSDAAWLVALTNSVEATGDDILESNLQTIMKGGPEAQLAGIRFIHNTTIMTLKSLE